MDSIKIINGLAALLYYEKPQQAEGKTVQFEAVPEEDKKIYYTKAGRVLQLLSKLNVELVEAGSAKQAQISDQDVKEKMFSLLKSNLAKMKHPKNLMNYLNDDVLRNIAINLADGKA